VEPRDPVALPTFGGKQIWADTLVLAEHRIQENVVTGGFRLLDPADRRLAAGSFDRCRAVFDDLVHERHLAPRGPHLVVLLHGFLRSKDVFTRMRSGLLVAGFDVAAVNYPSSRGALEDHADHLRQVLSHAVGWHDTVSFVGHSMGGLVARALLARPGAWRRHLAVNRLVTIGTPHRGAELATLLGRYPVFHQVGGPSSEQLRTDRIDALPLPTCPFGTIAGVRGDGGGYNPLLEGEDDMVVSASSAILDEAEDQLVLPALHTFIMNHPEVVAATARYLRTGRFRPPEEGR
jgi:pimeloyl-ACP methyl ester carboxylesterase